MTNRWASLLHVFVEYFMYYDYLVKQHNSFDLCSGFYIQIGSLKGEFIAEKFSLSRKATCPIFFSHCVHFLALFPPAAFILNHIWHTLGKLDSHLHTKEENCNIVFHILSTIKLSQTCFDKWYDWWYNIFLPNFTYEHYLPKTLLEARMMSTLIPIHVCMYTLYTLGSDYYNGQLREH